MKTSRIFYVIVLAAIIAVSGCASQPKLTHDQILGQFQQVAKLDAALQEAESKNADMLAPEGYSKASDYLESAMSAARNNKGEQAEKSAAEGLKLVDKLNRDTESSREILAEVISVRDRAYKAGADTIMPDEVASLDKEFKKTAALVERGSSEQAKQNRPELIAGYSEVELTALKQGTIDVAKAAIADAKKQGATKHAPQTLAQAEEEMKLALSILDADRTQTTKAETHAQNAKWLAEKSAAITESIKDFDRRDYSMEEVMLWHQQQLSSINAPLGGQLPFNQPSDKVVLALRDSVSNVVNDRHQANLQLAQARQEASQQQQMSSAEAQRQLQESQAKLATAEQQIATLMTANQVEMATLRKQYEEQLALTEKQREAQAQMTREEQQKFESVQSMFNNEEANVYRQRQNVLISVHGFQFPTGQSEIQADNFPLMNKIIQAIRQFPKARIQVVGHTDSTGNDDINLSLSQSRADKVARFLTEVGGISPDHIASRGDGETKPVASNETREGRAANRRVEIAIVNEQ